MKYYQERRSVVLGVSSLDVVEYEREFGLLLDCYEELLLSMAGELGKHGPVLCHKGWLSSICLLLGRRDTLGLTLTSS